MIRFSLFIFLLLSIHLQLKSQWETLIPEIEKTIETRMDNENITGMSMAIFSGDSIIYSRGFGWANRDAREQATDSTIYLIGSVTKLLTATMLLQQDEKGNINIYDEVSRYLPAFQPKFPNDSAAVVPIEDVMLHQAGLPSDVLSGMIISEQSGSINVANALSETYLSFPPGFVTSYSNAGFSLLGEMLEKVTGLPYAQLLQQQLFEPIGMDYSFTPTNIKYEHLISSTYDENGEPSEELIFRDLAAGGVYSNVLDMVKFGQMVLNEGKANGNQILTDRNVYRSLKIQNKQREVRAGKHIGYSWMITYGANAGKIAWHNGANIHYRAMFAIAPELDLGIVYLANSDNGASLASDVFRWLDQAGKLKGHRTEFYPPHSMEFVPDVFMRIRPEKDLLDSLAGYYSMSGVIYKVERKGRKLQAEIKDKKLEFISLKDGLYIPQVRTFCIFPVKAKDLRIEFVKVDSFLMAQQLRSNGHRELFGTKIERPNYSKRWLNRTGNYQIINKQPGEKLMIEDIRIKEENGFLVAEVRELFQGNRLTYAIDPLRPDLGQLMGLGRGTGDYLLFKEKDGREVLHFLGFEMVKVE